jgi:hypothetical protein
MSIASKLSLGALDRSTIAKPSCAQWYVRIRDSGVTDELRRRELLRGVELRDSERKIELVTELDSRRTLIGTWMMIDSRTYQEREDRIREKGFDEGEIERKRISRRRRKGEIT